MSTTLPWVKYEKSDNNSGNFVLSPLKRGMGTTIGNSLRRVLLSSLSGAAIVSIKIDDLEHEYTSIPHVVEDAVDIIFNLKGVVFKSFSKDEKAVKIKKNGKGIIKAKDIICDPEVEIINPDHYIAEISGSGKLNIEMKVKRGFGYVSAEANLSEEQVINEINVDSTFSPILRVNHDVENIRVGKELDYDLLKLEVCTNGSVTPEDAVKEAADILIQQFGLFGSMNEKPREAEVTRATEDESSEQKRVFALKLNVDDLELSARSSNCLKRAGIENVEQLVTRSLDDLIQIKNFGKKSADEINDKLKTYGLSLKDSATEGKSE